MAESSSIRAPAELEQSLATVGQTASYLAMAARGLLVACGVVLLAFYWSLQGDRTVRWLLLLLPVARRDGVRDAIAEIEGKVGACLRGQGLVCLAMAAMAAAVYGLLGLRYAVVLGLIAGLMEVLPVLGPVLGAIPPLSVAIFTAPGKTPWVLLAAVLMQQVEGYLLVPRIMDKSVGVHPLVTLLAIAAFGSVFGLAGAILAIPLAALVQVLLNRYLLGPSAAEPQQPCGRGTLSVLHYDVQQLLRDIRQHDKAETSAESIDPIGEAIEAIARDLNEELQLAGGRGRGGGPAMTRLAKATAAVVATLLGLAALWEFRDPVLIFLLSLVVAAAARAPVDYLAGRGLPKSAALAAVYVAGLLVVAGLVVAAIYLVSGELGRATDDFKELYEYAAGHSSAVLWIERTAGERLPPADELLTALVGRHGEQAVRLVLGTAFGVVSAAVDVVFVIVLSIYWAARSRVFRAALALVAAVATTCLGAGTVANARNRIGAYARSELAQSLLAGIVLGVGFYLLG